MTSQADPAAQEGIFRSGAQRKQFKEPIALSEQRSLPSHPGLSQTGSLGRSQTETNVVSCFPHPDGGARLSSNQQLLSRLGHLGRQNTVNPPQACGSEQGLGFSWTWDSEAWPGSLVLKAGTAGDRVGGGSQPHPFLSAAQRECESMWTLLRTNTGTSRDPNEGLGCSGEMHLAGPIAGDLALCFSLSSSPGPGLSAPSPASLPNPCSDQPILDSGQGHTCP